MASTKSFINIANKYDRVILLIDMDCFYCQVEEKLDPELKGKPIAVVQYNAWRGGGIIAVNYPAREQGVTRHMRGDEAKEQCPDIVLVKVPSVREKADLTKYREAGKEVATVLQKFTPLLERASVDEAYLDITDEVVKRLEVMNQGQFNLKPSELNSTYAVGYSNFGDYVQEISSCIESDTDEFDCNDDDLPAVKKSNIKLLLGAAIANEIRAKVKEETGYECSAGIAHNKILAKLACGINKPNKQTLLPLKQIQPLFSTLPLGKIKGLGGKFGEDLCTMLNIKFVGDLIKFSEAELQRRFDEKNGSWLYLIARGIDLECVTPRFYSKSIGCCKKFPGRNAISGIPTLEHWLGELAKEICERMEKDVIENNRKAKQMVVSYIQEINGQDVSSSRSVPLSFYDLEAMAKCAFDVIRKNTDLFIKPGSDKVLNNPLKFLGISVGKFETIETNKNTIQKLFMNHCKKKEQEGSTAEQKIVMEKEKVPEQKVEKKSFFANYLKKKDESVQESNNIAEESAAKLEEVKSSESNADCKESKSFFLKAIRKQQNSGVNPGEMASDVQQKSDGSSSAALVVEEPQAGSNTSVKGPKSFFLNAIKRKSNESNTKTSGHPTTEDSPCESQVQNTKILEAMPSTSSASNYTDTYAEFLVPEPKEQDFTTCDKCGKKVLAYDFQTHNDFHFALELSQEQREKFRSEVKSKIITTPPRKKSKISSSQLNTSKKPITSSQPAAEISIAKFLSKEQPNVNDSDETTQPTEKCIECGNLVPTEKIIEHLDYHAARKIQVEWNKQLMTEGKQQSVGGQITVATKTTGSAKVKTKNIKMFFATQT